jgi:hypothetical protein
MRLYGSEKGPLVAAPGSVAHVHDLASGLKSWWTQPTGGLDVRGLLRGPDGEEMLLLSDGVVRVFGNMDGGAALSSANASQPRGVLAGIMPTRPGDSTTMREIRAVVSLCSTASASSSTGVHVAVRADGQDSMPPIDVTAALIGTDSWGTSKPFKSPPLQVVAPEFDVNTFDMGVEVAVDGSLLRVGEALDTFLSDSAPERKTGRG